MDIKLTNNGHRRGFVQGHSLAPDESVILKDVNKDGLKQLESVQWLGVEIKKEKESKEKESKTKDKNSEVNE